MRGHAASAPAQALCRSVSHRQGEAGNCQSGTHTSDPRCGGGHRRYGSGHRTRRVPRLPNGACRSQVTPPATSISPRCRNLRRRRNSMKTAVALSLLCALPVGLIERGLVRDSSDLVLVFAKALGLDWETTRSIAVLGAGESGVRRKGLRRRRRISKSSRARQRKRQSGSIVYGSNPEIL